MFKAGAKGYLLKECVFDELVPAIRTVLDNQICLSSKIDAIVIKDCIKNKSISKELGFTKPPLRECEVVQFIADRETTK